MQKAGRIAGIGLLVSSFLSLIPSLGPFLDFTTNTFVSLIIHLIGLLLLVVGALMLAKATGRKKIASYFVGSAVTDVAGILWTNFFYFPFLNTLSYTNTPSKYLILLLILLLTKR